MFNILKKKATLVQQNKVNFFSQHYLVKLIVEKDLREQLKISWEYFLSQGFKEQTIKPIG